MKNKINNKKDGKGWIGVSKAEQEGIEAAIDEMNAGKGIPHEEVMSKMKEKYNTSGMKSIKPLDHPTTTSNDSNKGEKK